MDTLTFKEFIEESYLRPYELPANTLLNPEWSNITLGRLATRRDDLGRRAKRQLELNIERSKILKSYEKKRPAVLKNIIKKESKRPTYEDWSDPATSFLRARARARIEPVVDQILSQIPLSTWKDKNAKFIDLAMGGGQFIHGIVKKMKDLKIPDSEISKRVFGAEAKYTAVLDVKVNDEGEKTLGNFAVISYNDILEKKFPPGWPMKFDVVVGNPPFSEAPKTNKYNRPTSGTPLYDKFFKKSLELANIVAMVLPRTDRHLKKEHNDLLRKYNAQKTDIEKSIFPNIQMSMWYVICDKNSPKKTNIKFLIAGKEKPNNSVPWTKGKVPDEDIRRITSKNKSKNRIAVYHKLGSDLGVQIKYVDKDELKPKQLFPEDGYALIFPMVFGQEGWRKVQIVKCNGMQAAYNGLNVVFTDTKKQAKSLVDYMKTPHFINQANKIKKGFDKLNISSLRSIKIDDDIDGLNVE